MSAALRARRVRRGAPRARRRALAEPRGGARRGRARLPRGRGRSALARRRVRGDAPRPRRGVGATASRRGGPRSAAFSSAKGAQRSLAESMARHLWPAGVHVAPVVIDGVVDLPRTRARMPDKPDSFFVEPEGVASAVAWVVSQPRSAWSFEVEARPFGEAW